MSHGLTDSPHAPLAASAAEPNVYAAAAMRLGREYSVDQIARRLVSASADVMRVALIALGNEGTMEYCRPLLPMLHHADAEFVRLAEHALWSIWMRAGSPRGNQELMAAVSEIKRDALEAALQKLEALVAAEPDFAEAHHQRALTAALLDQDDLAERSYDRAIRLNPIHFAAFAGLGQIATGRGALPDALRYYRQAARIHPRLDGVPEAIRLLEAAIGCA